MLKTQASKLSQLGLYPHVAKQFYPPPANCVLYLPGYPPSTTVLKDHSGQGNDGAITGATPVRLPSGLWGLSFDSVDDYVNCGNSQTMKPTAAITLKTWAYFTKLNNNGGLIYRGTFVGANGVYQLADTTDNLQFALNGGAASLDWATGSLSNNIWYHIVGVYDKTLGSDNLVLYVNGIAKAVANYTTDLAADANSTYIGGYYSNNYCHRGYLALGEINVLPLSAAQVADSYQKERHLFGI